MNRWWVQITTGAYGNLRMDVKVQKGSTVVKFGKLTEMVSDVMSNDGG